MVQYARKLNNTQYAQSAVWPIIFCVIFVTLLFLLRIANNLEIYLFFGFYVQAFLVFSKFITVFPLLKMI